MPSTTPIYGNYTSYYAKRPLASGDTRLSLLPKSLFTNARVLDIGCNEGWVTCEIAQSYGARRVIGVDIDSSLISAAWKRRRVVWSLQGPDKLLPPPAKRKRDPEPPKVLPDYFPESLFSTFGPLPVPTASADTQERFPHNLTFRTSDWLNNTIPEDSDGYDVIIAFSLSKWIHLNNGDSGIMRFFERVYSTLNPGGTFILEPQSWESYNKSKRLDLTLKENASNLKLRPDDFRQVLLDIGFSFYQTLGPVGEGGFRRPVDLYQKSKDPKMLTKGS